MEKALSYDQYHVTYHVTKRHGMDEAKGNHFKHIR